MSKHALSPMAAVTVTLAIVCGAHAAAPADRPAVAPEPAPAVIAANNGFGLDLYAKLAAENAGKNLFFSPYSITSALAMTAEGARGPTLDEMARVLRYPAEDAREGMDLIHQGYAAINRKLNGGGADPEAIKATRARLAELRKQLDAAKAETAGQERGGNFERYHKAQSAEAALADQINKLAATIDQYDLRVANALWGEKTYPFKQDYLDAVARHYDTGGVFNVDFRNDFPAARMRINGWVAEQTQQRIKNVIPDLPPEQAKLLRLILTNAIYFKGEWSAPFDEKNTENKDFTLADGEKVQTPIMHADSLQVARYAAFNADGSHFDTPLRVPAFGDGKGTARYPGPEGFAMVELPYKGGDLSMVLIAPNAPGGLAAIEKQLSGEKLAGWIGKLAKREVHVRMPKFKLETKYELGETLAAMGMKRAFTDPGQNPAEGADFSGMTASGDPDDRLFIAEVIHKAFVEVNEKGTEAAAATAVLMIGTTSAPVDMPFSPTFTADRPFIYLIREKSSGTILFLGRMMNPTP